MQKEKRSYSDRRAYLNNYYREYYSNPENKKKIREKERKRALNNRRVFKEWKATLSCEVCGESHPACLEFHHKNPEEKDYTVSNMSGKSMSFILKEAAKCLVLCANCHRKLHNPE